MVLWLGEHADDVEADFLVFYRVKDPWSLPADRFLPMARRLFFYQGVLQNHAMVAQEEAEQGQDQGMTRYSGNNAPNFTENGTDMRHNQAAAKAAGLKEGTGDEVKVVPAAQWVGLVPPGTVEHVEVKV